MNRTLGMLLAGGAGSRLGILAYYRAKPAVPFGGFYRIIDFTLSNASNSGIKHLGVLTQYKPLSLMEHIGNGEAWGFVGRMRGIKILPPRTGEKDYDWYRGTADAVRQNIDFVNNHDYCDTLLILSGDHIYHMDYSQMVRFHREMNADLTIATMEVPLEEAHHFGIAEIDHRRQIVGWEEKPQRARSNLASMGIYVFSLKFLMSAFAENEGNDFGKNIVPFAYQKGATYAYPFTGYWRDVGTVRAYWQANLDLLDPRVGIDPGRWQIYTNVNEEFRVGDRPPSYIGRRARIQNSLISQGCTIEGEVVNSIISTGVFVQKGAIVTDSVVMQSSEIGENAVVDKAILDKNVNVRANAIVGYGNDLSMPNQVHPQLLQGGLTVIGKNSSIPERCVIGRHCLVYPGVQADTFPTRRLESGGTIREQVEYPEE